MKDMKKGAECNIVRDLLPLYHDGVCSGESRAFVEAHLAACDACAGLLGQLEESRTETEFEREAQNVLKRHARREQTLAVKTGVVIAGLLMIPVMIALLLTFPGYSDWKTDAVLVASMLLVAGMTVVPLLSKTKKLSKTILFSVLALLLVIFFVEMLFDDGGLLRFGEIACSTIFGLSLALAPIVICQANLPETLQNQKGLLTMGWDTIWFYLMLFMFVVDYPASAGVLLGVSTYFAALAWLIFLTVRYLKGNAWVKTGIVILLAVLWTVVGLRLGIITVSGMGIYVGPFGE